MTLSSPPQPRNASSCNHFSASLDVINALKKPAVCAIVVSLLILCGSATPAAFGASGGRVGGRRSFSRPSSSSYSSRSYSIPRAVRSTFSYSAPYKEYSLTKDLFRLLFWCLVWLVLAVLTALTQEPETKKFPVFKLQVGLLGSARRLKRNLNRIAETANTSSPQDLRHILTETTKALIKHPEYCISGYSFTDEGETPEEAERSFNQLLAEERSKYNEGTMVNEDGIQRETTTISTTPNTNEYIVITILVLAKGVSKLPEINDSKNLKEALQKLRTILTRKLFAVEVLWTPQNENDILTEQDLVERYPLLRPL